MPDRAIVKLRVDLGNGQIAMLHVRSGQTPIAQALAFLESHGKDPKLLAIALAERIRTATAKTMSRAHTSSISSYRAMPLQIDDSDESVSDELEIDDQEWDPNASPRAKSPPDTPHSDNKDDSAALVVKIVVDGVNGERELRILPNDDPIEKVYEFSAANKLSDIKRKLLLDHVFEGLEKLNENSVESAVLVESPALQGIAIVASPSIIVNVVLLGSARAQLCLAAYDDLVGKTSDVAAALKLTSTQTRRLFTQLFLHLQSIDRSSSTLQHLFDIDPTETNAHSTIINVDKVIQQCERMALSVTTEQRQRLFQSVYANHTSMVKANESDVKAPVAYLAGKAPELALSAKIEIDSLTGAVQMFELWAGDNVLERVMAFCKRHSQTSRNQQLIINSVIATMAAATRAPSSHQSIYLITLADTIDNDVELGTVLTFADRFHLSTGGEDRERLIGEVARMRSSRPSVVPLLPTPPAEIVPPGKPQRETTHVFERLFGHALKRRQSIETIGRSAAKPPSMRMSRSMSVQVADDAAQRLYDDALKREKRAAANVVATEEDESELTFKPVLSKRAAERRDPKARMFTARRASWRTESRQLQLQRERETEMMAECTFKPNIIVKPEHRRQTSNVSVVDRLTCKVEDQRTQRRGRLHEATLRETSRERRHARKLTFGATIDLRESSQERLDRLVNSKVYMKQAIEAFQDCYKNADADGVPLFKANAKKGHQPRMPVNEVGAYQHASRRRPVSEPEPDPPLNEALPKSRQIFDRVARDRLSVVFGRLALDGVVSAGSRARLATVPHPVRQVVSRVLDECGEASLTFAMFCESVHRHARRTGLMSSAIISPALAAPFKAPVRKARKKKVESDRDVYEEMYQEAKRNRDRREMLRFRSYAIQIAECKFLDKGQDMTGSAHWRTDEEFKFTPVLRRFHHISDESVSTAGKLSARRNSRII